MHPATASVVIACPLQVLKHNDSAGLYVGGPVPGGVTAAATPATAFTLDAASFMALLREPRAKGATRVPPTALGRCWAWTGRQRSRRSAASSPSWRRPGRPRT
jgi:hypothetical protein